MASAIHALGGTIDVETAPGKGTTFILSLPVTLAIVRSLIVEIDQERFAVPLAHVAETVRAEPEAIREINHRGVTLWRGDLIHVADGGALLGTARRPGAAPLLRRDGRGSQAARRCWSTGWSATRTWWSRDSTRRSAGPTWCPGTTILGDGRVACIVDAVRILEGASPCRLRVARNGHGVLGFADAARGAHRRGDAAPRPGRSCTCSRSRSDREEFGIPVTQVREVIRVADITRVPQAPAHVRGVANLRGRILAVVELRSRLGLPAGGAHARGRASSWSRCASACSACWWTPSRR